MATLHQPFCAFMLVLASGAATACGASSKASSHDAGSDVSSSGPCDKGAGNLCDAGSSCATTVNAACVVTTVEGKGTAPAFTGGAIADGTYALTAATAYGPSNGTVGQKQRITWVFAGTSFTLVQDSDTSCNSAPTGSGTFATSGTQLTLTLTCPASDSPTFDYTATGDTLSYSGTDGTNGTTVVFTFTRQ
jgi:Lipocalin-like domain